MLEIESSSWFGERRIRAKVTEIDVDLQITRVQPPLTVSRV